MTEWWVALGGDEKIFYGIAFASSLVMFVQFVLTLIGGVFDVADGEFEIEGTDGDLGVLSIRTICAFFVGFGWGGITALNMYDGDIFIATIAGFITGSLFLFAVLWTMRGLHSLKEDGTVDIKNSVGTNGRVYLPVPPNREGTGLVQVVIQGREREVVALTDSAEELENRTRITVLEQIDPQTVLVGPIAAKTAETTDGSGETQIEATDT
ncbi:MAG: hypothetical protein VYB15_01225 [Planctomycetota bacterium]|nr:hypothetical protein [Planctomycetota bacterium]MEE3296262.1 hypothetical protein [Planctomycetota bacterium]